MGQILATGILVGTQKWENDWSWRVPLFIQVRKYSLRSGIQSDIPSQMVPAALNVFFIFLCPESYALSLPHP